MSRDFVPREPIATWNTARGVWETGQMNLFCEHLAVYSEIFPASGTMRAGKLYPRQRQVLPTAVSESSSLLPDVHLLPSPVGRDYKGVPGKNVQMASLPREISLLPTPNTMDAMPAKSRQQIKAHRDQGRGGDRNLREAVLYELESDAGEFSRWGKYEAAIRRWEAVTGCPAPEATEPGKEGKLRLSANFVEFVMGVPCGWVTSVPGLSRTDQLRCLGNGCVPAQVVLALHLLLR